ncbi:NTP transferase domain-containing protein [Gemmiger formicilis]|uniref:NTP transferase domain-containing protein n=1 Tax=Gemmiger formicilis TaxID=745368 RepID=UPI00195AC862|nr:NTP transferase domain-containing protein [Gemmiger formicilis]MBM6914960.1 NTP transferase domain-containing protein [Gemmiger formicilis]
MSTTGALILAAGLSSRMGRFKPLLPLGESTFIDHLIHTMHDAGVKLVVVVTGWHAYELEEHFAGRDDVILVHNPDFAHTHMFYSIQLGLAALQGKCDKLLFSPADVPLASCRTMERLLACKAPFACPLSGGKTGHPAMLDAQLIAPLLAMPSGENMRSALTQLQVRPVHVVVDDPAVCMDADTPESYGELLGYYSRAYGAPRTLRLDLTLTVLAESLVFDETTIRFLELVEACGSMQNACRGMHISYSTAWRRIVAAEEVLGFALLERESGGAQGGRSRLTPQGHDLLTRCKAMQRELLASANEIFQRYFADYSLPNIADKRHRV